MNFALPEMRQCLNNAGNITGNGDQGLSKLVTGRAVKPDPGVDTGWVLRCGNGSESEMGCVVPTTASCVLPAGAEVAANCDPTGTFSPETLCSAVGGDAFKKRKADSIDNFKVDDEQSQDKKLKESAEESSDKKGISKSTKNEPSFANPEMKKRVPDLPKPDYIHVRARRGQATDSHSLAERVRREKISERMKYLQDLVPGCNKIIGKAGLLDEVINYVQSLQRQVEFLSMKLAEINPRLDFDVDDLLPKEMHPVSVPNSHNVGLSSDMVNPANVQFSPMAQGVSSCLNQIQCSNWDSELHNAYGLEYQQARSASYVPQPFIGTHDA